MTMEEEDLNLPRAAMNKIIKDTLPTLRVANEARDTILTVGKEFIKIITKEAIQVCEEHQKKTMTGEHVLMALEKMQFHGMVGEAKKILDSSKGKKRRQSTRLEHLGIPEEELLRQQQELFARARAEQTFQNPPNTTE